MELNNCDEAASNLVCNAVVPKHGVNYPPGVICDSSGGNVEPKSQFCSIL